MGKSFRGKSPTSLEIQSFEILASYMDYAVVLKFGLLRRISCCFFCGESMVPNCYLGEPCPD